MLLDFEIGREPEMSVGDRIKSGNLLWNTNFAVNAAGEPLYPDVLEALKEEVGGAEFIVLDAAMSTNDSLTTGIPTGIADMVGAYVDSQRWREVHPLPAVEEVHPPLPENEQA